MQNRGRSTVEARAARATLNNAGRVKSKECVLSSSPQDVDRGREKPFPVGGHRAELAGALFGGRKLFLDLFPDVRIHLLTIPVSYLKGLPAKET
jgi:hypothetical protein